MKEKWYKSFKRRARKVATRSEKPTPYQVEQAMKPKTTFEDLVRFYPPTAQDIIDKND